MASIIKCADVLTTGLTKLDLHLSATQFKTGQDQYALERAKFSTLEINIAATSIHYGPNSQNRDHRAISVFQWVQKAHSVSPRLARGRSTCTLGCLCKLTQVEVHWKLPPQRSETKAGDLFPTQGVPGWVNAGTTIQTYGGRGRVQNL